MAKKLWSRARGGVDKVTVWDDGMVSAVSFTKVAGVDSSDLSDALVQGVAEALAAAGTNQATAAQITYSAVAVTASDGTKGVKLPAADNGSVVTVINTVADQILKVYPATGDAINAESANAAVSVGPGKVAEFIATSSSQWYVASASLITATTTELNNLAGVAAGTVTASKAVVVGANKNIDTLAIADGGLKLGAGAGTAVSATAAELNVLDGIASTVTIALAASATTDGMDITITAKDAAGATVAVAHQFEIWMSDAATGIGLTTDAYSGDLTASVGAILSAHTAKKHWSVVTAATGIFTATLVDSANPADQYVACKKPVGAALVVSAASGTNWEGV